MNRIGLSKFLSQLPLVEPARPPVRDAFHSQLRERVMPELEGGIVDVGHGLSCTRIGNMPCGQEQVEQGKKEAPTISGVLQVRPEGAESPVASF
jgi:hypothetical protein